jgi:hypothetical protein
MRRRGRWAMWVVLLVVGLVGVLAIGAGYAKDENASSRAKCSNATLKGTYLFAADGVEIKGDEQLPFAYASYVVFDGNGKAKGVVSSNFNGEVSRKQSISGTYTVKADCTGTAIISDGTHYDQFIAPDGSKLTAVQTHPKRFVSEGSAPRVTAKRVGE